GRRSVVGGAGDAGAPDPLHRRVLAELASFTGWLERAGAQGYIGEVGWPDDQDSQRWCSLARSWCAEAVGAGLWADLWATGEWWPIADPFAAYTSSRGGGPLSTTWAQGELLTELAPGAGGQLGINVAGAEFGAPGGTDLESGFSNEQPGTVERDYHYDGRESSAFLAAQGLRRVRLPFRWERVQRQLGGPLDGGEVDRLLRAVERARSAGLGVVLDVHNYGAYFAADGGRGVRQPLGGPLVTTAHLADLWRRLSGVFAGVPGVTAYGLMNEPVGLPEGGEGAARLWERASQEALDAIRSTGDGTLVMVAGYAWSHARSFAEQHPTAWIDDPAGSVRYEAHHYWQRLEGRSYDEEVADARREGH
ncbi:MAG: GH5_5 / GH5 / GH5_25, partial [uncultured Quadrisphaera sp.]